MNSKHFKVATEYEHPGFGDEDKEFQHYKGNMPDKSLYCPEQMSPSRKLEFEAWYKEAIDSGYQFDYDSDLITYCRSDLDVLRCACLEFRKMMMTTTAEGIIPIDPFNSVTIASACMTIYRSLYLKKTWSILYESEKDLAKRELREPVWSSGELINGTMYVLNEGILAPCNKPIAIKKFMVLVS